jgi:hypothetical protein
MRVHGCMVFHRDESSRRVQHGAAGSAFGFRPFLVGGVLVFRGIALRARVVYELLGVRDNVFACAAKPRPHIPAVGRMATFVRA